MRSPQDCLAHGASYGVLLESIDEFLKHSDSDALRKHYELVKNQDIEIARSAIFEAHPRVEEPFQTFCERWGGRAEYVNPLKGLSLSSS